MPEKFEKKNVYVQFFCIAYSPGEGLQQNLAHKLVFFLNKMKKVSEIVKIVVRRET